MRILNKASLCAFLLGNLVLYSQSSIAASMTIDSNGGLEVFEIDNKDKNYWFKIGGKLAFDTVDFYGRDGYRFPSGSMIRRAQVTLKGGVGDDWVYKLDIQHGDSAGNSGRSSFGESFIAYQGFDKVWVAFGQVSMPFSHEGWQGSHDSAFMEASLPVQAFSTGSGLGTYAEWHGENVGIAVALRNPPAGSTELVSVTPTGVNTLDIGTVPGGQLFDVGGRIIYSPLHVEGKTVHTGLSYRFQDVHNLANNVNFSTRPELRSRQAPLLFTNIPPNSVHNYHVTGIELAGQHGPFVTAAEYIYVHVNRDEVLTIANDPRLPAGDFNYHGYYVMASYVLGGEPRTYDMNGGTFNRPRARGHCPVWEIALRHSYIKLLANAEVAALSVPLVWDKAANPVTNDQVPNLPNNNPNDMVGNAHSTTLAINCWINENVRLMGDYVHLNYGPVRSGIESTRKLSANVVGARIQVKW